jgi:YD repeat-containing protein
VGASAGSVSECTSLSSSPHATSNFSFANGISIAAEDGSELYVFTETGRHLRTLDALTGAVRFQFTYDTAGRLATIIDGDGNVTTIERNGSGNPSAIVGPFGQRTSLAVNGDGYLSRVTNPAGEAAQLAYNRGNAEGLLATLTDPRGNVHRYLDRARPGSVQQRPSESVCLRQQQPGKLD